MAENVVCHTTFSGDWEEPGLVPEQVKNDQGIPLFEEDGVTPVTKMVKGTIRTAVTILEGQVYPANHAYVKKWPHHFGDRDSGPVIEQATTAPGQRRGRVRSGA